MKTHDIHCARVETRGAKQKLYTQTCQCKNATYVSALTVSPQNAWLISKTKEKYRASMDYQHIPQTRPTVANN